MSNITECKKISPNTLIFKNKRKFFFVRDLDAHFNIELFNSIKILLKNKRTFDYIPATEYGLTGEKRTPELIISLTSYPARITTTNIAVNTLLRQTVKPDKIILWLAEEEFPNKEADLPKELLMLKDLGLDIKWCENIGPYKKLVPSLIEYPDDIIVTADDDLYYQEDWLESLYSEYVKAPDYIYTRRATGVYIKNRTIEISSHYANSNFTPTYLNQLLGGAGTLFPPHTLYKDATNIDQIRQLIPTHDDTYYWIMAVLNRTKIKLINNKDVNLFTIKDTQHSGLCKLNKPNSNGLTLHEAYKRILEKYPDAYTILKEECIND